MFTNKDRIYQIKNLADKTHTSLSNGFSDRWIFKEILKHRAFLIEQKYRQKIMLLSSNYQETPCMELEERPISECKCEAADGCILYRTKLPVPKRIVPLKSVFNPSNSKQYQKVDISKARFRSSVRYKSIGSKSGIYYLSDTGQGEYLYLLSDNPMLGYIVLSGIFENPLEVQTMPDCEGNVFFPCRSYYEYEMKIDEKLFTTVQDMIIQKWWNIKFGVQNDLENNANTEK